MKKLLTLLIILISINGLGQSIYPTPYNQQGSPSTLVQVRGGWKADSTAMMPKYVDTITANLYKTKLYAGSIIFTTGDGNYWYRSADAARWLLFGNSVTNCLGTQLISGSITWSGSGLIFDATDLDYSIICTRYSSSATTLTLSTADPTYARIDKLYADITGNVGVITGTPAPNPQEPVINPLSQLDMGIVYIPAGSTVPAGTTQTVIYNENVEWTGTSDVPSINFAYATNPYIGSLSTYIPSAPNSSYVEWQSGGIDYLFSEAQYLKFWVRLNADFTVDPLSFLDVTFEYTDVTVSQTLAVGNGDYNMDYSLINQWQLVSIPLTGITTFGASFNSVHFVINSAPTSFQLDYVYLLETATVPPVISSGWSLNLNTGTNPTTNGIGTSDSVGVAIKTNSETRAIMPANGLQLVDDTTYRVMVWNETTKEWAVTYMPTILADPPLYIYTDSNFKKHIGDTSATAGGNCGLISGGEVTPIDTTTFNISAAYYCIESTNYSSLDSVVTLATPGDTIRIDVIGVDTSGQVFTLTGVESVNPSIPSIDATYQLALSFVLVSTDSITPYNPSVSWSTKGNAGTNPYVNFLGTTDDVGFMIRTNGVRSAFIDKVNFSSSWGIEALNSSSGSQNNAIGYGAGFLNSTGSNNNYLGNAAGYVNTIGSRNTAIGGAALYTNIDGDNNTAIGYRSLLSNLASGNTSIGYESLMLNTTGDGNTAVGNNALNRNTTANNSTAVGEQSLNRNTTGEGNTALGYLSSFRNTTGTLNVAVGIEALSNNVTGSYNTVLGAGAATTLTGSYNTIIGRNAGVSSAATDSSIAIGSEASASTRQLAFSSYINTMYLNLDSASGTAPAIAGIDANGNWRKYATPSGGSPALTSTYVGVGNVSNVLSGSTNFTDDGSILTYNGAGGVSIPNGGLSVAGGTISAIDYTGDWTGSVINPLYGGTGVNNGSNTITLGGNLTTSGAFASTFTMTAATGVTFPTTGTLATLAGSETFTNKTITSPTLSGTLIGSGTIGGSTIINTASNVSGNLFLATSGVRSNNNTNIYWNSGPVMLGNTNDLTLKNAAGTAGANVSIGSAAAVASAQLEVTSTTKGFLPPRMTATQGSAISSPAEGLLIYVTDTNGTFTAKGWWGYNGAAWEKLNN